MCHPHIRNKWNQHQFGSVIKCVGVFAVNWIITRRCGAVSTRSCLHTRCCIACVLCCMLHSSPPHEVNGWICTSVDRCRRLNTCSRVSNGCAERHRLYFRSTVPGRSMCITRAAPGWRGPLQTRPPRAAVDGTQLVRTQLLPRVDSSCWSEFICYNLRRSGRSNDQRSSRTVRHACLPWAKTNCDIRRATTKYKLINLN